MSSYKDFAMFYDIFTKDVNYKKRTEYLLKIFKKFDRIPTLMLDLACGTGGFSLEFAKKGISVIGVDASSDMLSVAEERTAAASLDILYLNQPAENLELYGTVDGAVCCLDSLNHITDYRDFCKAVANVALFLEKDRLFIFDVNTEYKHNSVLADNTFVFEEDGVFCVWQNEYEKSKKTTNIKLDFFSKNKAGDYERYSESFCERAYTVGQIKKALEKAKLKPIAVFAENTFKTPAKDTERMVFVAKKL